MRELSRVVLFAAAAVALSSCAGIALPRQTLHDPSALLFNGYTRAEVSCFTCHNGDGQGTMRGPSLAKGVPKKTDEQLTALIKQGKGIMPGYQDQLSPDELTGLIGWLRATFPAPISTP